MHPTFWSIKKPPSWGGFLLCKKPWLDVLRAHFFGDVIGLTDRQGHDGERWVFRCTGGELAAVGHEQVFDVVALTELIDHAVLRVRALPCRAHVVG